MSTDYSSARVQNWSEFRFEVRSGQFRRELSVIAPSRGAAQAGAGINEKADEHASLIGTPRPCSPGRIPKREVIEFMREVANLMNSGISMSKAMGIAAINCESPTMRGVIGDIIINLEYGLEIAFSRHEGTILKPYHISMLKASGVTAGAASIFSAISDEIERSGRLVGIIILGISYPIVISFVAFTLACLDLVFVWPGVGKQFRGMDVEPPAIFGFFSDLGDWVSGNLWVFAFPVVGAIIFFSLLPSILRSEKFQRFSLKLPAIGKLVMFTNMSRALRVLVMMDRAGVVKSLSLATAKSLCTNVVCREYFEDIDALAHSKRGHKGTTFAQAFIMNGPRLGPLGRTIGAKMTVSEETGDSASLLAPIVAALEEDSLKVAKRSSAAIAAAFTVGAIIVVGFCAGSVVLPNLLLGIKVMNKG